MASRATIRDRVKYLPSTRISGIGETSGFDPATMKDQLIWSPRWPLLASAPATVVDGQSWRIAEAGQDYGREYLGRSVCKLEGDNISLPLFDYTVDSFEVSFAIQDYTVGVVSWPGIYQMKADSGSVGVMQIFALHNCAQVQILFDLGLNIQMSSIGDVLDGNFHRIAIGANGNTGYCKIDGVITNTVDITAWRNAAHPSVSNNAIYDSNTTAGTTPLYVADIQQSVNGVLIDSIPCTETTGTTLANITTPSRPATLSDATAHDLAWVPQDDVTMDLWLSNGIEWMPL